MSLSVLFGWQVCFLVSVSIAVLTTVVGRWCFCDFWFWIYSGRGFWTNPGVGLAHMVDADRDVIAWCKIERGRFVPAGPLLRFPSRWLGCLLFGMLVRVGEACVPGPNPGGSSTGSVGARATFRLGVCNANGASEKISELYGLNLDLLAVSETHLTDRGLRFFRSQLKVQAPSARWFVHGKPVCPRGVVSDTGKFSGVGLLSRWPAHSLPHDWEPVVYSTGRLSISSAFVHGLWISGCVVYCPPAGPTHLKARHVANSLLGLALDRVLQLSGPRYICGDFNHDLSKLEVVEKFKQAGFIELQELNLQRHAVVPTATCRGKTRRDFCFISAELALLFSRCDIFSVDWSDHDVLVGTFECTEADRWRFPWPIPSAIPWRELQNRAEGTYVDFSRQADPSVCYRQLWEQTETEAQRVASFRGKPLHHSCLGRGSRDSPLATKFQVAPIREGRPCDVKPSFLGFSQQHRQWCRQARRLESYVRLVKGWNAHSDADHRSSLWTSILRAPGFRPSFQGWWSVTPGNREFVQFVPDASPCHVIAEQVFLGFEKQFRSLEQHLKSHQRYVKQFSKVSPIGNLYKSVRRDPPQPVELLTRTVKGTIAALDFQDAAIEFDADCDWDEKVSFVHAGKGSLFRSLSHLTSCMWTPWMALAGVMWWFKRSRRVIFRTCLLPSMLSGLFGGRSMIRFRLLSGMTSWNLLAPRCHQFRLVHRCSRSQSCKSWFALNQLKLQLGLMVSAEMIFLPFLPLNLVVWFRCTLEQNRMDVGHVPVWQVVSAAWPKPAVPRQLEIIARSRS